LYERQRSLETHIPSVISVVGVGGIGTWVGIYSALLGSEKILLFDSDSLEVHNLNRLPYTLEDIGKNKAQLCREFINRIRPDTLAFSFPNIDEFSLDLLEGVVFICTDNFRSQEMIREYCVEKGMPFLHLGCDGRHFTIESRTTSDQIWSGEIEEGYRIIPSYVITPAMLALLGLLLFDLRQYRLDIDISSDLKSLIYFLKA